MQKFKGRPVLPGNVRGHAVVSRHGLNMLASIKIKGGRFSRKVTYSEPNDFEPHGNVITGAILCLPQTIGSTIGGRMIEGLAKKGLAPKAMLFSLKIDTLAAAGVVLAEIWAGNRIVTVDELGSGFLETVQEGQIIEVHKDGTVILV